MNQRKAGFLLPERIPEEMAASRAQMMQEIRALTERNDAAHATGIPALRRLLPIAQRDTGQSRRVARFLPACYNGPRFPFDLSDLRGLDLDILGIRIS